MPIVQTGIIPVIPLAAGNLAAQPVRIIGTAEPIRIAAAGISVAPIGERHVVVDANRIDRRMRPKRVEVIEDVARARRLMPEILAPVRPVADLRLRPEYCPDLARQRHQRLHKRKRACLVTHACQATQL
jgi:hypothetical protein